MGVEFIDTSPEPTIVTIKTEQAALKVLLTQYANTYTRYINEKKNQATDNINSSNSSIKSTLDTQKAAILNPDTAFDIIKVNTSVIKRPLIEINNSVYVGFNETTWNEIFK